MQQQRHEDSSSEHWLDVADFAWDVGDAFGDVLVEAAGAVLEIAGELLFSLLDGI